MRHFSYLLVAAGLVLATSVRAEPSSETVSVDTEHFTFEFGKEFEHTTKESSQGTIHLLRYAGPEPAEGKAPSTVQITAVEMLALNKIMKEGRKQNPSELAMGALGGIIMSHRKKLKAMNALLAVSDKTTVMLKNVSGATQQIQMNMFKGEGYEQLSDYYVLTDAKNFFHVQGIYFPAHGVESQKKIDVLLNSLKPKKEE